MKIILLTILLLLALSVSGQTKVAETGDDCLKDHETNWDFFTSIRFVPNIKIINLDRENNLVYFKFEERKGLHLVSFKLVRQGIYPPNFYANLGVLLRIAFCDKHKMVWVIEYIEEPKPKRKSTAAAGPG
jgi:hypothetical protein